MYYKQETDWSCGASALRNALSNLGFEYDEPHLIQLLKTDDKRGTWSENFKNIINMKLDFFIKENVSFEEIELFLGKGYQIITVFYVLDENVDHYTLIKKIKDNNIFFQDSWFGNDYCISLKKFHNLWHSDTKFEKKKRWIFAVR